MTHQTPDSGACAHRAEAPASLAVAVLSVSDTRSLAEDASGALIVELLAEAGHRIADRALTPDEPGDVARTVLDWVRRGDLDVIIVTGGTGVAPRDTTPEALTPLFDRRLPGFGEIFRMLSYDEIGSAAMLSRADAGIIGKTVVFALPGSRNAVRLAMERLIIPEAAHLVYEARKRPGPPPDGDGGTGERR